VDKYKFHIEQTLTKVTIFFQLDACRNDYINNNIYTPFLFNLKQRGISGGLIPTFGFEPDSAYFAGLSPDEADGGAQFWHDLNDSPFSFLGQWARVLNLLPDLPERVLRRLIKCIAKRRCISPTLTTARIPFNLLKYFSLSMQVKMDSPTFVKSDSIFDSLRNSGKTYLYHGLPDYKIDLDSIATRVEKDLVTPLDFAFFHIGDLDRVGHKYGPESEEIRAALKSVDKRIEQIYKVAKNRFEEIHLVIMGDHGMMEVRRHLDIWSELKKLPIKLERDYLVFLDSTMARFWFSSTHAEKLIVDLLNNIGAGQIIGKSEKDKYHLNYSHAKFGEIIFLVDSGVLIFPNFYQNKKPVKGMHGYAPKTPEQQSALLIHSPKVKESKMLEEPVDMRRVFPTLLDLLDLPKPEGRTAKSLL
jgi:Type I phosphodiesterase / nucleotide pyrophosphatase